MDSLEAGATLCCHVEMGVSMVSGVEIVGAYQGLKTAFDLVQGLNATAKEVAINQVKFELGRHILDAQQTLTAANAAQADSAERIRQLEQQIVALKDWSAEQHRYELKDTGQGTLAYALKPSMGNGEPEHWLCPNCYQQGKKSILKHETIPAGRARTLVCHPCGMDIVTSGVRRDVPRAGAFGRGGR